MSSYLSSRFPVIRVVWATSTLIWMILMGTSSSFEGCTRGVEDETHWRELHGAWSGAPWPATTSWATASTWSFSSVGTPAERSPRILMMQLGDGIFRTRYPYWAMTMNWY
jgi:hypothetical protein